ncbi:MAG: HDOD domain-containing protein [Gemmatimonadaceae bacterium]|jgi:putative nucleotidyltransferase with HDIG domain|nr:HDOD domain-containing protein [Gemmatimonadaceae bacterium]
MSTLTAERSLTAQVTELVDAGKVKLPLLPQVVLKAQQLLATDRASAGALAALLEQDPAMTMALIRLANSATFGGLGRVDSLNGAIQRIGLSQVGALITGLGVKAQFAHPDAARAKVLHVLWTHSITTAFAAKAIAKKIGVNPERAFLAGLLHDCGKVLVLSALDALIRQRVVRAVTPEATRDVIVALHAMLGHRMLTQWALPADVASAALLHHEPAGAGQDLLLCVQAANLITRRLGFHPEPDPTMTVVGDPVITELGLTDVQVATMMVDLEIHLEEMQRLF